MRGMEIAVLAYSYKLGGSCVAGATRDLRLVRPVSAQEHGVIPLSACRLPEGELALLDVLDLGEVRERLRPGDPGYLVGQPDNVLCDPGCWRRVRRVPRSKVRPLLEQLTARSLEAGSLLLRSSTDRLEEDAVRRASRRPSLAVVRPRDLVFEVRRDPRRGRRRLRACFEVPGGPEGVFDLAVTDIAFNDRVETAPARTSFAPDELGLSPEVYLCLSLGEPFEGYRYKLVAGVIDAGV